MHPGFNLRNNCNISNLNHQCKTSLKGNKERQQYKAQCKTTKQTHRPWVFTYTIYTSFGYHTFRQPISKTCLAIEEINKSLLQVKFQRDWKLWKIGAIQNRYPIVVHYVMSDSESKNPWPMYSKND